MNVVPIVFAFDNNIIRAACVCISSLLMNAKEDTFYDIFILHAKDVNLKKDELNKIPANYKNCKIQYRVVGDEFDDAFEIRHVTKATYYRLLIPNLIPEYDKIIYADVDIIFRMDLSDVYQQDLSDYYVAATLDLGINVKKEYIASVKGLELGKYIQAGFLIFNLKQMREDNMVPTFLRLAKNNYTYQDQDVLNIACGNRIKYLPPCYNVTDCALIYIYWHKDKLPEWYSEEDCKFATQFGNIHYSGYKPWNRYAIGFDVWWEYYRKSPFFDEQFYFKFFFDKTMLLESLTLWKRIKILIRYFVYGRYKG